MITENINWEKTQGLLPAIIQHATTGKVLMLGFMNQQALDLTLEHKKVYFYSRSRQKIWLKGESSGNFLSVCDLSLDCDQDTLLIMANPSGETCHTGSTSCFTTSDFSMHILSYIEKIIIERQTKLPTESYVTSLFESGINRIAQKVGEEAVETVIAALAEDEQAFLDEVADLIFHLQVLLIVKGQSLSKVMTVLQQRVRNVLER